MIVRVLGERADAPSCCIVRSLAIEYKDASFGVSTTPDGGLARLELSGQPSYRSLMKIGGNIQRIRQERDLTLEELSEEAGVPVGYLKRIEAEKIASPGPEMLERIATGLGVKVGDLFDDQADPPKIEVVMLSSRPEAPEAFVVFLRNHYRRLTLDERVFLEQTLDESRTSSEARQAEFYDFWKEQLDNYRGSPRQSLLQVALGTHPDFDQKGCEMLPQIWSIAEILLEQLTTAVKEKEYKIKG